MPPDNRRAPPRSARRWATSALAAPLLVGALTLGAPAAGAQEEMVVVAAKTGTRIRQPADSFTSFSSYDAADLQSNAVKDIRDLVAILPASTGAENNADNLTQNYTQGTANVNLRGLGVASTLVLLNGRRQTPSAVQTDDGSSFVDLAALVPALALERVEALKDGASAIYGSEAVAGVVNFITKRDYEGARLELEYRGRTNNGSQDDINVDGVFGRRLGENASLLLAGAYLNRTKLVQGEADWRRPSTSSLGNPPSFVVNPGAAPQEVVPDPGCAANGGMRRDVREGVAYCLFDYGPHITAVPTESRFQGYAQLEWRLRDAARLWAELGYARNNSEIHTSPSFPVLSTPTVPADHPGNIFGNTVVLLGRPYGAGQPSEVNKQEHDTLRIAVGAEGRLAADLSWDFSYARGENNADLLVRDTDKDNFQRALNGLGGADCDPDVGTPGQGDCRYFNPFSSSFSAQPGDATYNHPSLRDFIIADAPVDARSKMDVAEANLSGLLFDLPGGPVGFALGAQYRHQSLRYRYGPISQRDGFAFLIGDRGFSASGDSYAVYGEARLPLAEWLEVTGALRYEDYGAHGGDTVDPKAAILLRLPAQLSLRGSFSTSFRAPSIFQSQGARTNFVDIDDAGNRTFAGRRIRGNPDLAPETSRAFSVGAAWSPLDNAELSLDYWNYAFEDALRVENAQAIVDANPRDPRIERTPGGTISIIHVAFVNADAIDTSGLDLAARAAFDTGFGVLSPFFEAAYLLSYDVTFGGRKIDALGRLNQNNVGAPNQRFKGNLGLGWSRGNLSGNVFLRHVGRYKDDAGGRIDSFTTVDANLRVGLGGLLPGNADSALSLGVINLADQDPPAVNILGSYDPRSADPRGRRAFVKLELEF